MSAVLALVAFLVLFPLGMLLFGSLWTSRPGFPGTLTLDNYLKAYANGERVFRRRGHDIRRIRIRGLRRTGKLRIRIVAYHSTGAVVVSTRRWNGCKKRGLSEGGESDGPHPPAPSPNPGRRGA